LRPEYGEDTEIRRRGDARTTRRDGEIVKDDGAMRRRAFLSPFSSERYFFPWTPIQVSPMRINSFFTSRSWSVLKNELVWIWLPGGMLALLSRLIRLWMKN